METFDLTETYVHLEDGPRAAAVSIGPDCAIIHAPGETLHVTRGAGTETRSI